MADQKISQFNSITTPDAADEYAIVDVSVSETKKITQANLETSIATGSTFITAFNSNTSVQPLTTKGDIYTRSTVPARLPVGTNGQILSADSSEVTGLKWIDAPAGGGGGGGLSKLTETFAFGDFANVGGDGVATFTEDMPVDAVPVGVVYEITSAFDATMTLTVRDVNAGSIIGGQVDATAIATLSGETDGNNTSFDFDATPNPVVVIPEGVPTQGSVTVTILYSTAEVTNTNLYVTKPFMSGDAGTSNVSLGTNTTLHVGMVTIPERITVSNVSILCQAVNTPGTIDFTVYSEDGATRHISGTTATINVSGTYTTAITPVTLSPGRYYFGFNSNGTADVNIGTILFEADAADIIDIGSGPILMGTLSITASTPPATIDPTAITAAFDIPLMRFS